MEQDKIDKTAKADAKAAFLKRRERMLKLLQEHQRQKQNARDIAHYDSKNSEFNPASSHYQNDNEQHQMAIEGLAIQGKYS